MNNEKRIIENLVNYIHNILEFVDVESFEDEENVEIVNNGYEEFVKKALDYLNRKNEEKHMNGIDLIKNLIDELARAKYILLDITDGTEVSQDAIDELIDDIRADIDRYYDVEDSINACVEDIKVE